MSGDRTMLFLPYTPRADADARGYDEWLRTIDNPFFNSRPGIAHYSNWKVRGGGAGFSHFDFLELEDGVSPEMIWSDAPLASFAADWVRLWGVSPEAEDPSVNYHCYVARRIDGDAGEFADRVIVRPGGGEGGTGEGWTIDRAISGQAEWSSFSRTFGPAADGAGGIEGVLIAAPDRRG